MFCELSHTIYWPNIGYFGSSRGVLWPFRGVVLDVFFTHQMWLLCVVGDLSGLVLTVFGTHWSLLTAILGCSIFIATVFLYIM